MKYKHIIFDVDGTLLDTEFAVLHSLQDTVMQYSHISIPIDKLCFALGIPGKVALERLGIEDTIGANEYWNEMMQKYHKSMSGQMERSSLLNTAHFGYLLDTFVYRVVAADVE